MGALPFPTPGPLFQACMSTGSPAPCECPSSCGGTSPAESPTGDPVPPHPGTRLPREAVVGQGDPSAGGHSTWQPPQGGTCVGGAEQQIRGVMGWLRP